MQAVSLSHLGLQHHHDLELPSFSATSASVNSSAVATVNSRVQVAPHSNKSTGALLTTMTENNNILSTTQMENVSGQVVRGCASCGRRIHDRYLLKALDSYWHTQCLKCSCCQVNLDEVGHSCFTKHGMILCKMDYIKMFGTTGTCSSCAQQIPADQLVMRTQTGVYHLKCFTCAQCNIQLNPGDKYSHINGNLFCEHEFPKLFGVPNQGLVLNTSQTNNGSSVPPPPASGNNSNRSRQKKSSIAANTSSSTPVTPNPSGYPLPVC